MRDLERLLRNLRLPFGGSRRRPGGVRSRRPVQPPRFQLGRIEPPPPPRGPVPWRRIGNVCGVVALVAGLAYGAAWLVLGDALRVHHVDVVGAQVAEPNDVAAAAALAGDSMFTVGIDEAVERVEALPAVRSATASKAWPRGVTIEIEEHQAWGYWQAGDRRIVIDEEARPLVRYRPPAGDAVTIHDLDLPPDHVDSASADPDTVRLVARLLDEGAFQRLGVEPDHFVFRRDSGLTVIVQDGPNAVLGDSSNYEFKVSTWDALIEELDGADQVVTEIDLRFGRNVVLRGGSGDALSTADEADAAASSNG